MADNFGLKIGVEGEKEFKKALSDINQSFKVLGSEMTLVSSQFDKQDKSVQAVTARNQVLNKEIDTQKDKISTLEKALQNASDSFGETDKRTQNWQIQLNKAQAELNGMERELKDNEKALDSVGDEFDDAEKQADQFSDEIKKSANTADDAGGKFEKLGGVLKGIVRLLVLRWWRLAQLLSLQAKSCLIWRPMPRPRVIISIKCHRVLVCRKRDFKNGSMF